jgi:hypothetical protein
MDIDVCACVRVCTYIYIYIYICIYIIHIGSQHQRLVRGRSPRHRGVLIGTVERVLPGDAGVVVSLMGAPIKRGDGIRVEGFVSR